jgi:hypothetical protein
MNIQIGKYLLKPESLSPGKWNLSEEKVVKSGKRAGERYNDPISYAVTIEMAVSIITAKMGEERQETVSLMDFLTAYQAIQNKLWLDIQQKLAAT